MADALTDPVAVARELADDVLFPAALEVDRSGTVPVAQLDRLADTGLYGLFSPAEIGGLGAGESDIELPHPRGACALFSTTMPRPGR